MLGSAIKSILEFLYLQKLPKTKSEETATNLLVAADKFQCELLKLYIESVLVERFLKMSNAAPMLLIADSYSCALLKEAAIDLFRVNPTAVASHDRWSQVQEFCNVMKTLLRLVN